MKILIATDGSGFSDAAIVFAARLLKPGGKHRVKLITVIEPAAGGTELETIVESTDELLAKDNPEAQAALKLVAKAEKAFKKKLGSADKIKVSHDIMAGSAARTIVDAADNWKADLIVLAPHGRGFLETALMGSVSKDVVHHARTPVLLVR